MQSAMRVLIPVVLLLIAACAPAPPAISSFTPAPSGTPNATESETPSAAPGANASVQNASTMNTTSSVPNITSTTRIEMVQGEPRAVLQGNIALVRASSESATFQIGGRGITLAINETLRVGNSSLRLLETGSVTRPRVSSAEITVRSARKSAAATIGEGSTVANVTLVLVSSDEQGDRALFRVNGVERTLGEREDETFGDVWLFVRSIYYAKPGAMERRNTAEVEVSGNEERFSARDSATSTQ